MCSAVPHLPFWRISNNYNNLKNNLLFLTGADTDDDDTDAARLMSLPVLLQRSVMAPLLAQ